MNTIVDVLEVMRKSANVASMNALDHGGNVLMNFADDCEAARAAVAELMEEHQLLLDAVKRLPATDGRVIGLMPLIARSESALARVKGV